MEIQLESKWPYKNCHIGFYYQQKNSVSPDLLDAFRQAGLTVHDNMEVGKITVFRPSDEKTLCPIWNLTEGERNSFKKIANRILKGFGIVAKEVQLHPDDYYVNGKWALI